MASLYPETSKCDYLVKVLLVGTTNVGKSSLLLRYTTDDFDVGQPSTVGVDFKVKETLAPDGSKIKVTIWDTAGQERFRTLTSSYFRGAHGIILVFDVTSKTSFEAVPSFLEEVSLHCANGGKQVIKLLVGNKTDKVRADAAGSEDSREVSRATAESFARANNLAYFETSAKLSAESEGGVNEMFQTLFSRIVAHPELLSLARVTATPKLTLEESFFSGGDSNCCLNHL